MFKKISIKTNKMKIFILVSCILFQNLQHAPLPTLNNLKFLKFRKENPFVFILFHEPSCQICPTIIETMQILSKKYIFDEKNVKFAIVDISENQILKNTQKITRTPTIRFYLKGEVFIPYLNTLHQEKIENFIDHHINFDLLPQIIQTENHYLIYLSSETALYFSVPEISTEEITFLENVQRAFPKIPVFYAKRTSEFDLKVQKYSNEKKGIYEISKTIYLTIFKRIFDEGDIIWETNEKIETINLIHAILTKQNPLVRIFNDEITDLLTKQLVPTIFLFDENYDTKIMRFFEEAAKKANPINIFVKSNFKEKNGPTFSGMFEKDAGKNPIICGFKIKNGKLSKFKLNKKPNLETISKFIEDFQTDKLPVFYKIGKKHDNSDRKIMKFNRDTYIKATEDPKKILVIGFIAKWCNYCHEVNKLFEESTKLMKYYNKNFQYALVDLDDNDIDDIDQSKIPLINVFIPGRNESRAFFGLREADVFLNWLEKETGKKLYDRKMPKDLENELNDIKKNAKESNFGEVKSGEEIEEMIKNNEEKQEYTSEIEKELEIISKMSKEL